MSTIQSVVTQMQAMARVASGESVPVGQTAQVASLGGFAAELQRAVGRVEAAQMRSQALGRAFELGDPAVALHDVMIEGQKASLSLQSAVQVRNRLVSAYQEIAGMPV